jgi:5-(hydroxymethyl)furfural/furfural oxidase
MYRAAVDGPYDLVIAGAGAAGCVLAARLSDIPGKRVLLIEAGADAPPGTESADVCDPYPSSAANPRFLWPGLEADICVSSDAGQIRKTTPYLQGRGVGGSSNVNGMFADRGLPADYDEWSELGAVGWGWQDVLPYFRKLECDADFGGPLHGKDGPLPIRRLRCDEWAPFASALARSCNRHGAAMIEDANGAVREGLSSVPMNCLPDRRVSASMAYLTATVRKRPNLTILPNTNVLRLVASVHGIEGLEVQTSAGRKTILAAQLVLCCGAVHSPALLLRSGIGAAQDLRRLGIRVVRDIQGVGRNLQNHSLVSLATHLRDAGLQSTGQRAWQQNMWRYSSGLGGCSDHDMLLLFSNKAGWHPLGRRVAGIGILVLKAFSKGRVDLAGAHPAKPPRIRFDPLEDPRDFERLVQGLGLALDLINDAEVRRLCNEVFVPNAVMGGLFARRSRLNWALAAAASGALLIDPLRRAVLRRHTVDVQALREDENARRAFAQTGAQPVYHACGTCKMGSPDDPLAVVDSDCRVRGVPGLRVIDSSVFPSIPSAATHLTVLMVAEKMADKIKLEWSGTCSV